MYCEVFLAAKNGDLNALEKFYRQNPARLGEATFEGNTALHIAAGEGHVEVVTWILSHLGSRFSKARNADLNTPLHEAAKGGNAEIVMVLLRHRKSAVFALNQFGETPLLMACERGNVEAATALLAATPLPFVLWPRVDRQTCLHVAAFQGHLEVVRSILRRPSCFNILRLISLMYDVHGATPLHSAVHGGHVQIVRAMLDSPSSSGCCGKWCERSNLMTKMDNFGRCAVHVAAMKGQWDIVEAFLSSTPDCTEIRSSDLKTVLHFAVEHNQYGIMKKILALHTEGGEAAKLVSGDREISGNTVLHLAASSGVDPQLVQLLLSLPGVNVNAVNADGKSVLDLAEAAASQDKPNSAKIVELLEDAGGSRSFMRHSNPWHSKEKSDGDNGADSNLMQVDTLVASLVAGLTFAAVFAVPDIIKQHHGDANLALRALFQVFIFSDSLALFASLGVVLAWLFRERLEAKLVVDKSMLADFSVLSLGTSVVSTVLAFLSATVLMTVPINLEALRQKEQKHFREYHWLLGAEMLTAFSVPTVALALLATMWVVEYNFKATVEYQSRLWLQLKHVLAYIVPSFVVVVVVIVGTAYNVL